MNKKKIAWQVVLMISAILLAIESLIGFLIIHWFATAGEYDIGISMIFLFPVFLIIILGIDGIAWLITLVFLVISIIMVNVHKDNPNQNMPNQNYPQSYPPNNQNNYPIG